MKVEVIIERGADGLFAAYSETEIGLHGLAGYGDTAEEAIEDFKVSVQEMNEMRETEKLPPITVEMIFL